MSPERDRREHETGLERAAAEHELEVLREQERRSEQRNAQA
jgi:hypothetical protein